MTSVTTPLTAISSYIDQKYPGSENEFVKEVEQSTTVYVGNLSFYTTEEQMYELFSKAGEIKRIIMGLDRLGKTPCGFSFVEYYTRQDAEDCMKYVNGSKLDDRVIRTDWDPGFREGRQYGRGKSGGQVRDEYRQEFDAGRGGWGHEKKREMVVLTDDVVTGPTQFATATRIDTGSYPMSDKGFQRDRMTTSYSAGKRNRRGTNSEDNNDGNDSDDAFGAMNQIDLPGKRTKHEGNNDE